MEFTLSTYLLFIKALKLRYTEFIPYVESTQMLGIESCVLLRHDVDRVPENSLKMAQLENALGVRGTYYFRIVEESFNKEIIEKITDLGHEIGYHYEDVDLAFKYNGLRNQVNMTDLIDEAYKSFTTNLLQMREVADIKTICMHGSPKAKYDNKIIWEKYNYKDLGLLGEPYLDLDFNEYGYLSDTGRRWNGNNVSVRDKVESKYKFDFKSTFQIIDNVAKLPPKVMFTIHPERWNDNSYSWMKELISQNVKNVIKKYFFVKR